jgi:chemotaxis signal transduction protein
MGIPENAVTAILTYREEVSSIIKREGTDLFFSLPHFFELADKTVRHGVVLKPLNQAAAEDHTRMVLLVSAVEREADIPPEAIFPLPEIAAAPGRAPFFTGVWFNGDEMIVFVEPAALIARILQETEGEQKE